MNSLDYPIVPRLSTVVQDIDNEKYILPCKPFTWNNEQRLSLFDSIINGLPIGSLVIWRTNLFGSNKTQIVLDGYQRLITLYSALSPAIDADLSPIYYQLEDKVFNDVGGKNALPLQSLLFHHKLFFFQKDIAKDLADWAEWASNEIRDYPIPILSFCSNKVDLATKTYSYLHNKKVSEKEFLALFQLEVK